MFMSFYKEKQMKIDIIVLGAYQTNCYILQENQHAKDCLLIDTGLEPSPLFDYLEENNLNPIALALTHGHADHIAGIDRLKKDYPKIKVYIHRLDAIMLTEHRHNLSALAGETFETEPADVLIEDGDTIEQAGISLKVFHTPGHTTGGICLYSKDDNILFSGDSLFADSIGRTDFPGGNMTKLITAIKEKLLILPDRTTVYPGHGPATTIAQEKKYNPYLI
jgi:glyoxylase-like metal-dependent hydrolase (beta-lactamase superfamily II)